MAYQNSLFPLEVMQDRTGSTSGHLRLPAGMTRGDCVGGSAARMRGEQSCPFLVCKYHLVPELVRLRPKGAINAMARRLAGEIAPTCVLDVADQGPSDDQVIGDALGINKQFVAQRAAEAMHSYKELAQLENASSEAVCSQNVKWQERQARRVAIWRAKCGPLNLREVAAEFGCGISTVEEIWRGGV